MKMSMKISGDDEDEGRACFLIGLRWMQRPCIEQL